ncbi:MAG: SpoIIE family protein phosphatase [Bacteroidaceae bacterium]|nr:SpoIIE family protein phosphatase [Bacteroidaceae bacterium]
MATKILSVDDEVDLEMLITQFFRRQIRKGEYEFYFAHNGLEALKEMLKHPDIDIILSDINMPEMDGLTLLARIREMNNPAQKCIMVSAYGDMHNIRAAMNGGAFDFATKPIDMEDLAATIEKAREQIAFVRKSLEEHKELNDIHSDLEAAKSIQQAIVPHVFPPFSDMTDRVDIFAHMQPAKDVGGDFYDLFKIDNDHVGFVMADVSGKGIPAAIFMAVSRTILRTKGISSLNAAEVVEQSNDMISYDSVNNMFVTVFYGIINVTTGDVQYVNAGHNPPYILHADGSISTVERTGGMALGLMEGIPFKCKTFTMSPGDMLICYTDGVTEAFNEAYEEYGEERFEKLLPSIVGKSAEETCEAIKESVHEYAGEAPQSDDITMMAIKRI